MSQGSQPTLLSLIVLLCECPSTEHSREELPTSMSLRITRPYNISISDICKHIHTARNIMIIRYFVSVMYCPLWSSLEVFGWFTQR